MTLEYEQHGSGETLVLLHAFPLSRKMWRMQAAAFASENIQVVLPDLPGFGDTPVSANVSSIEEMALRVAELIDKLGIKKAIIGGLSMGGYVTFNLFRMRPDLFRGAVFCDTAAFADTDEKRIDRSRLIEKVDEFGMQPLIDEMLPNLVGETTKENNPALVAELEAMVAETDPNGAIAALRGMAERKDHEYLLPAIDVPVLFIVGSEDRVTSREVAEKMHNKVKGSHLAVIERAGHFSNLEDPFDFNRELSAFCRSVFREITEDENH